MILHALVSKDAKRAVAAFCQAMELPCRDLTGDFVDFLSRESGLSASDDAKALHHVDEAYKKRIRAIEFTTQHDDGLGLNTLAEADIVLAGVSRTSKTPTSVYLAQQGYKVANISLAMGVEPPPQLLAMPPRKVVGLVIDPTQLLEIRSHRQHEWRMGDTRYADAGAVEQELQWSRRLFVRQGWAILDVTDQAIEETAAKVLQRLGLSQRTTP
jgi:[pyruvate, water dikinase]-phosphate phosphotransferase / [pyruvate, water dikinase] kinase